MLIYIDGSEIINTDHICSIEIEYYPHNNDMNILTFHMVDGKKSHTKLWNEKTTDDFLEKIGVIGQ